MPAFLALSVLATGLYFSHADWEVACDNTGTCRAAGYSDEGAEAPMTVLLTRKAGPAQPVTGELQLADTGNDSRKQLRLAMTVNGKALAPLVVDGEASATTLSDSQVKALLAALPRKSQIVFRHGKDAWRLSDKGAAAVLLKMDEFQRRIGTSGALLKPGSSNEDKVLMPSAPPVVVAGVLPGSPSQEKPWAADKMKALRQALRATPGLDDCDEEFNSDKTALTLTRLGPASLLASRQCYQAAYNAGDAFWVINEAAPFKPVLVTTSGSDYIGGRIVQSHKGRGVGDCFSHAEWTWDGNAFVKTSESTTGMCRQIAPGGAWSLPSLVSDVR